MYKVTIVGGKHVEAKKADNQSTHHILYALSIHLKYGEILHVESVDKETKDSYLNLAKNAGGKMLIESKEEVRQLLSDDIAKVSVVAYDETYLKVWHPLKRITMGESSLPRFVFSVIVKLFIFLSLVLALAQLSLKVIDGTIMDVLFDPVQFSNLASVILAQIKLLFRYTFFLMILLHILDMALSFRKVFYINQDGAPWVEHTVTSHMLITLMLFAGYIVMMTALKGVIQML